MRPLAGMTPTASFDPRSGSSALLEIVPHGPLLAANKLLTAATTGTSPPEP
jgi:hypothetical protein